MPVRSLRRAIVVAILASAVAGCEGTDGSGDGAEIPVPTKMPDSDMAKMKDRFVPQKQSKGGPVMGKKPLSPPQR
jgi:hypothetical protein